MSPTDDKSDSRLPFICHVNLERGFRGGERQTELLVRQLAGRGWRQRLVLRSGAILAQRLSDVPRLEIKYCSGLFSAAFQIGRPDLVHVHQGRAMYPAYIRKLFSLVPYIITRRVSNPPGNGWSTRRACAGASRLVAVSSAVARVMSEALARPQETMAVVADAFEPLVGDLAAAQKLRAQWGGEFVVGHVGALDHAKGQEDLIRVARVFSVSHPHVHFVLVGSGRDEQSFREQSRGLSNLHFAGFQDRVGDYLAAFDVFAFPSLKEGLGSTLLDAMDHELAVVASNVGGIPEVVVDGETGLLVPASNPGLLGQAILKLYLDPQLRRALGQAGKQRSRQFTATVMAERYIRIYDEVLV
ncbi:MAG: glycosyltransferase family 4 protein [Gammaproteobacteria bacterium]|nr:glycosyltransferase family 4 protein [Gammaproteobacteria bacterium]